MSRPENKTAWRKRLVIVLQVCVHAGALLPLLWLFVAINRGDLGGDPVKELIHYLGMGALRLLLLTLLVSPLARALHFGQLNRVRRPLGLWCFTWASLHFSAWLALDLALDWSLIGSELVKRTYILLGFTAWLMLLALAVTSLPVLMRKMGKNWKKLHGVLYPVVLLVCWHFWWSVKSGWIEPAIYLSIALALLIWRRQSVVRWVRSLRSW
ncbi:protein-methionine-sulfoxide reductase heme-binding subunit MsrQ [Microbulbifer hydrolyticus]|uniref:Protein-methionine-sulfoxide reductase heme-binding subunit MsrQ n=1 Tax=Microbulbifer hydrolyticus TaxID=48074 RepID=A0A6P1TBK5_9GAMM|nr:protein-methionine-sulfoxide reductase heme-binding subunit MsrQ [Microbulbifer hydrolyticus]MBB5212521.1 sulfoxide reductase heme-binding subunit YedZ [Microbulbifer hydrolyticus]QHQ40144.1 sulfoxide reductase heme-binding subunit YedZ [Microbulbifer hydrolyticus]